MKYLINKNIFIILCPLFLICTMTLPAMADESQTPQPVKQLTGEEIKELLSGNSMIYKHGGRQFFHTNGTSIYQESENPQWHATWRTTEDQLCAIWRNPAGNTPDPERCYTAKNDNGTIIWGGRWAGGWQGKIQEGNVFEQAE